MGIAMEEETSLEEVKQLQQLLAQKDEQLKLAAEYGKILLDKNSVLEANNNQLQERIGARNSEVEQLREDTDQLEKTVLILKEKLKQQEIEAQRATYAEDSSLELESLRNRVETMKDQLQQVTKENDTLISQLSDKQELSAKIRVLEKEVIKARQENEELARQNEQFRTDASSSSGHIDEVKQELSLYKTKVQQAEESTAAVESKLTQEKIDHEAAIATFKKKQTTLRQELDEAHEKLEEQTKKLSDMKYTNKQLENAVAGFAVKMQKLEKQKDENMRFLEEARVALAKYRKREDESAMDAANSLLDETAESTENSLLGELEHELEVRLQADKNKSSTKRSEDTTEQENTEQYFYLATTAIKIQLSIQNPQKSEQCYRVNVQTLLNKALEEDIPFHEWYDWIRKELLRRSEPQGIVSVTSRQRALEEARVGRVVVPAPQKVKKAKSSWAFW